MLHVHESNSLPALAMREWTVYLRSAVAALLGAAAVFVASRRLAGAMETALGPFALLAAGLFLAGLVRGVHDSGQAGRFHALDAVIGLAAMVIAGSLSVPGSNTLALLGLWALIAGGELWVWQSVWAARRSPRAGQPSGQSDALPAPSGSLDEDMECAEPEADVLQQFTLRTLAEGGQELSGWLRMPLAAGQRTGSLHVAFCPPFGQIPQVQAEAVSGPDCRIKPAQVLPYGARLDVKLDAPAHQDESVLLWFFATSDRT
jgi:hypothetical protein